MPVVLAALVIVGMLCALNLILTLGVIKRLREHAALLAGGPPTIAVGEAIGEFSVRTVHGDPLSDRSLGDETLVAFVSQPASRAWRSCRSWSTSRGRRAVAGSGSSRS